MTNPPEVQPLMMEAVRPCRAWRPPSAPGGSTCAWGPRASCVGQTRVRGWQGSLGRREDGDMQGDIRNVAL